MLIASINPKNILSFGEAHSAIELSPLTILVGPNGSGKSNLIQCVKLLQKATNSQPSPSLGWLWQGQKSQPIARLEAVIDCPIGSRNLRYWLEFTPDSESFKLTDERIENEHPDVGHGKSYFYFAYQKGWPVVNVKSVRRQLKREEVDTNLSILAQRKDPEAYPEITWLGDAFSALRIYGNWTLGPDCPVRLGNNQASSDSFLSENFENLEAILFTLCSEPAIKTKIINQLSVLIPELRDINFNMIEGSPKFSINEGDFVIPISNLSDGTLRFLSLQAILCHPLPPPLICIEEPELGLHPEMMPVIADALREASQRTQIIVSTHSDLLVEEFIATPESIIVFEKHEGQTMAHRLEGEALDNWLDKFTLGHMPPIE